MQNRREFLATTGAALALRSASAHTSVPTYLRGYENLYATNPREAALQWFRGARFGMFIHYGLYSQLGHGEWVQYREIIPVAKYARLKETFNPKKFDADFITDLAQEAGMRYITITTRHHDSFSLFHTKEWDFSSPQSPARRDLITELAEACQKKGLGLCFYYSHGRDWKHPHAPNNDKWGGNARPKYDPPDPHYAYGRNHDLQKYLDFMTAQITELLTNYGPVAAIWLDGIAVPRSGDYTKFKCPELYDHIHKMQPQVLLSYKQGLIGTEDFLAPEHKGVSDRSGKPMEICTTLQERGWGYVKGAPHMNTTEVVATLAAAARQKANLLLNTGPLPDGSIHRDDVASLRAVGKRIRASGYPQG